MPEQAQPSGREIRLRARRLKRREARRKQKEAKLAGRPTISLPCPKVPFSHPDLGKPEYKDFYKSANWKALRYLALTMNGGCCECCGARASDGVRLHVDHIKPRSRYQWLELRLDNLQILCEDCNMGKGSWDETDWKQEPDWLAHWKSI